MGLQAHDFPPAPLTAACAWLDQWRAAGAGTTIGLDGSLTVWWLPEQVGPDESAVQPLLAQIDADAQLKAGVKAIVLGEAILKRSH